MVLFCSSISRPALSSAPGRILIDSMLDVERLFWPASSVPGLIERFISPPSFHRTAILSATH